MPTKIKSKPFPHVALIAGLAICAALSGLLSGNNGAVFAQNLLTVSIPPVVNQWYVSPSGKSSGDGTQAHPWDLATALLQPSKVHAGDEIWLTGGTYGNGLSQFNSSLTGSATSPIIVRAIPGQRATINGGLQVSGSYTWYWGFEVTNLAITGRNAQFTFGFDIFGPGTRFINLIVHDTGQGFGFWKQAIHAEIYGSLVYYNGYDLPDRGHGHGFYVQNDCVDGSSGGPAGPKNIENNIVFRQFANGTQLYGSDTVCGDNTTYRGNTFFNNGEPSKVTGCIYNFWIGAGHGEDQMALIGNHTYASPVCTQDWNLVFHTTNSAITGNYFAEPGINSAMTFQAPGNPGLKMSANTFIGSIGGFSSTDYPSNVYSASAPTANVVFVDPNKYELGRANITVYNWQLSSGVNVDISAAGLHTGDTYEVVDAENFFAPPVVTGTYMAGVPVTIPMMNLTAAPVSAWSYAPKATGPQFGAFVLIPLSTTQAPTPALASPIFEPLPGMITSTTPGSTALPPSTPAPPSASISSFSANPSSIAPGQSALLSWTVSNASMISIDNGVGLVTGSSVSVSPSKTTYYTLTASNNGNSVTKTATVTVTAPVTPPSGGTTTTTTPTGPAAYWSFDSATIANNKVTDLSGNGLNATAVNVLSVSGVSAQALQFGGQNSYITAGISPSTDLLSDMTLNAWIKTTNSTRPESIISRYDSAGAESGYLFKTLPSGVLDVRFGGNNVGGTRDVADTKKVNDGAWHMVTAVIHLGQSVQFYVDGSLSSTQSIATHAASSGAPLEIGTMAYIGYANFFTGSIDEVRLYGRALSSSEVMSLYQAPGSASGNSSPVVTPPTVVLNVSVTAPASTTVSGTLPVQATTNSTNPIASVQLKLDGVALGAPVAASPYLYSWDTTSVANGTHLLSATVTDNTGNTASATSVSVTVSNTLPVQSAASLTSGLVADWTFDTGTIVNGVVTDLSGNGATATALNVVSVPGINGQALQFTGQESYLNAGVPANTDLLGSISLNAWVKTTNTTRAETIISRYNCAGIEYGYLFKTLPSGVLDVRFGGNNVGGSRDVADTKKINDGAWHMVTAVINLGQNVQFYVDGALSSTQTIAPQAGASGVPLLVGNMLYPAYATFFTGSMDSVRVYDRALSASDVTAVFQAR